MKTLILNGSPRKNGDTAFLIETLCSQLTGEVRVIDCYSANISPCTDCRSCRGQLACCIDDDMQKVYSYLAECDNVVLASPVHYGEMSAMLLKAASRFQLYSSALIFRHEKLPISAKRGAVILSQGGSGGAARAYDTARLVFQSLGIKDIFPAVCSKATDTIPADRDEKAQADIISLANRLSQEK